MCMYNSETIVMDSSVSKRKAEISFFLKRLGIYLDIRKF